MEKPKTSIIWKMSDFRAKLGEIWDSRVADKHISGTFGLVAFSVILILRSLGALTNFPKIWVFKVLLILYL